MVPWGSAVLLCGTEDKEYSEAVRRLHRIGYQALTWNDWKASSTLASFQPIAPQALHAVMQQPGDSPVVVDVRLPSEVQMLRVLEPEIVVVRVHADAEVRRERRAGEFTGTGDITETEMLGISTP
jgi:hypothetical protein